MKILAVTACPTGVAHTYLAAESLEKSAKKKGVEIKVETQGSIGIENQITEEDVKEAVAVIIAADVNISNPERFKSMPKLKLDVQKAIKHSDQIIDKIVQKFGE
ncbi:PTS system IIB component (Fru family) [Orenia metallireducens]|jgi:fructose-specific phosphotransferase system IIB component|uniref:PTS system IIB component, Fru family n=1 Tax=Orenia metallireducens TaxID=1413210 RepID=A0A285FX68_9FIRM|nr:PTS fructose transporter subunit IIB [Orenia metallireducens]PRX35593.1 PTS system IIB component (Fru family) [Orenia metallireducens]SNY15845.1 PTS system IIB component, Fru family [Orenia metallireducens]